METVLLHIRKLRVDWLMFGAMIGLMLLGGAFVLSAAIDQHEGVPLLDSYFFRQLVFYGVGLGLAVVFVVIRCISRVPSKSEIAKVWLCGDCK